MILDLNKAPVVRSDDYLGFVRTLPCCGCETQAPEVDAHHCIADRHSSAKHSDLFVLPLCRPCHEALHAGWHQWELINGSQWLHVAKTIAEAARVGVIEINREVARALR